MTVDEIGSIVSTACRSFDGSNSKFEQFAMEILDSNGYSLDNIKVFVKVDVVAIIDISNGSVIYYA